MDINSLIGSYASALASNADLKLWANMYYGQDHTVFVNIDKRNPPSQESCPFIIIYPLNKSVGLQPEKKHQIEIDCCIFDEAEETPAEANLKGFAGVQRIETFRKMAEYIVIGTDIGNALIETIDIEYDVINSFPFHWAGMVLGISEEWTTGADPFE